MRVIEAVEAVDVFVNESGSITIQQEDAVGDYSLVVIPVDRVTALCKALRAAAKEAKEG